MPGLAHCWRFETRLRWYVSCRGRANLRHLASAPRCEARTSLALPRFTCDASLPSRERATVSEWGRVARPGGCRSSGSIPLQGMLAPHCRKSRWRGKACLWAIRPIRMSRDSDGARSVDVDRQGGLVGVEILGLANYNVASGSMSPRAKTLERLPGGVPIGRARRPSPHGCSRSVRLNRGLIRRNGG
jgi:hypothetical protein